MRTEREQGHASQRRSDRSAAVTSDSRAAVRLGDGFLYCLKVFLAVRIGLSLVALFAVAILPNLAVLHGPQGYALPGPVDVPGWAAHGITPGWHNVVTAWERFDGLWYLRIADAGYRNHDGSAAFFPLYPMLTRGISWSIGRHPLAAALLLSNAAFLASLVVMYALTARELSVEVARRATLYLAVFPTAFFFLAPYSESLFLLLVLLTFWWARGGRWAAAAAAALLAALTRNLGLLLALPLAVEGWQQAREARRASTVGDGRAGRAGQHALRLTQVPRARRALLGGLAAGCGAALGTGLYLLFWHHKAGDWLAPLHQETNWERLRQNPLVTLAKGTHEAFRWIGVYPGGYHLMDWLIVVPLLVAAIFVFVRLRPAYGIYVWASLLAPLSFIFAGRPLMSLPRFALPLFPVFWVLGRWTKNRQGRHDLVLVCSAGLLTVLLVLFVDWFYVF
jgi:hypothetical protein